MAALLWFALGSAHAVTVNMSPWWGWQMAFGVLVYWVIAGVAWATAAARISQERSLALMEAEAARVKSELGALRGQLDPHFLFNTLHTAAVLARHDPPAAATAIERLAELLRYVLDSRRGAREDVPLRDELAFVDAYLALESLRLGDRLRVVREIADDALGVAVPSLTLQPLVENALRYGISPRRGGGTLTVRGHLRDGQLLLEVGDDGPGAATIDPPQGTGIGLSTLRQRLTARFGSRACMHVRSAPGDGFFVLLRIPA
jgi:LytS/YehU family sensor histidine kinase